MATKKQPINFDSKIRQLVEQEAVKHIADAPKLVKQLIEGSLLSLLGLEKRNYNQYEIDHCNGRNSVLIDAFRNCAIAEAERIAHGYKPTKDELASYEQAFRKEFSSQMHYAIKEAAKQRANVEALALVNSVEVDIKAALLDLKPF